MMGQLLLSILAFSPLLLLTMAWDSHHNLHVPIVHNVKRRSVNNDYYTKILKFWADHKNKLSYQDEHKEVVLVMGNTGAGKSTIISAITGQKLRAVTKNAEMVIVDEEGRIGTDVSSKTLIPEAIRDVNRNVIYVDCPGFRDNREVEYEISSVYFQDILMKQVDKVKLILVINYGSLTINGNKNDLDDLFEHVGKFIKDISKFHDGIALVATKVNNRHEFFENGTIYLANPNQLVLDGIADYLDEKRKIYRSKQENGEKYKKFANLIDVLLQKKNNVYTRIAIFRNPIRQGLLENMKDTQKAIKTITEMITNNLNYVEKKQDDFGFALSMSLKIVVDDIIDGIFKNALTNRLVKMGNEILTHFLQIEKQYSDIHILRKRVLQAYNVLFGIPKVKEPLALFKEFLKATNTLNISLSLTNLKNISNDIKCLRFFTTILNKDMTTNMLVLEEEMRKFMNSLKNVKHFYDFLNNLQVNLDAYESQKLRHHNHIANIIKSSANTIYNFVQDITDLENIVKEIGSDEIYQKIRTVKLNQFRLKHLKAIFDAFTSKLEISCTPSSSQVTVKGYNIKMSDAIVDIERKCSLKAKNIQFFALNKVFIDCTIDKMGAEAQIFILAPTWEVIGAPKIILNGKDNCEPHINASAKSSEFLSENGKDGLPGLSGGPAGHFFGVGKQFINSEYLEIYANGGKGGPGQHGGNGADGEPGEEMSESFFKFHHPINMVSYRANHRNEKFDMSLIENFYDDPTNPYMKYFVQGFGKPAKRPTDGGDGGAGGKGGYPGTIVINGLGNLVNVKISKNSGFTGQEGQGGHGGKSTFEGRQCSFYLTVTKKNVLGITLPTITYSNIKWMDGAKVPAGKNGKPGGNKKYKEFPRNINSVARPYLTINSFKDFVRSHLYENFKESELRALIEMIENDSQIKSQYDTLAFVKELVGLENQFIDLRNRIDFVPFYDSLLNRIEEFAVSEKNPENKKVLSYLYTAALTKVITLKKKKKGKTVVNLVRYLNTIEETINKIHEYQHLQIVQDYRDDYYKVINNKIREANDFIEKIESEISGFGEESNHQLHAIIDEIKQNKKISEKKITLLEKDRAKIRDAMYLRTIFLTLKVAASALSFIGPVGATVGAAVTSATTITEGMLVDTTSSQGQNKLYSLDPNLKVMSRVTEVFNNKPKQLANKLAMVVDKLSEYKEELSSKQEEKIEISQKIGDLKAKINEIQNRKASKISEIEQRNKDAEKLEKEIKDFVKSRQDILEEEKKQLQETKAEQKNVDKIKKEIKLETRLLRINDMQSILNSVESVFNFVKKLENDEGMIRNIDSQISEYVDELRNMEKLEDQVYNILIPDLRQIEQTVDEIMTSLNGSSHIKLDLTKWTVRKTLREVKSLLQKFTHKMSFELQSNLKRFMEKIDEAFSILIDIYDRIDSYSDSVKQAEYIAHIVSTPMVNVIVANPELIDAVNKLKFIIQSNLLFEMYGIAIHAFKQHYFPFAAHVLQRFHVPTSIHLNDTETLRSHIIERIEYMKSHIAENIATIDEYSGFIHENKVFNSNITTGSSPFYVWKHDTIKDQVQRLLNGSEILIKADISKGLFYNAIKYTDIGINFKLIDENLQKKFNAVLKNFSLLMVMVGSNYYRCGERYYFMSIDDSIKISYTLNKDETNNWIDPNLVYTTIRKSHPFLSPYGMWSIKLKRVDNIPGSFDELKVFANESIDLELVGQGYYIEQDSYFNFNICNEYLYEFYNVENIAEEL